MSFILLAVLLLPFTAQIFTSSATDLLFPRQSTGTLDPSYIPPQCQSGCATIINTLTACGTRAVCSCTTANDQLLQTCVDCCIAANYTVQREITGAAYLTEFYDVCIESGFAVPLLQVSISVEPAASATDSASGSSNSDLPFGSKKSTARRDLAVTGFVLLLAAVSACLSVA